MKPCISCSKPTRRPYTHQQELHRASRQWKEKFVLNWITTKPKQVTKRTLWWRKVPSTNRNSRITMMPNIAPNNTTTKSLMQYSSQERSGGTNPFWAMCLHSYPAAHQGTSHKKANHPTFRHLLGNHSNQNTPRQSMHYQIDLPVPKHNQRDPHIRLDPLLMDTSRSRQSEQWTMTTYCIWKSSSMFVAHLNKELDHNCKWQFETRLKWHFNLQ